MPCAHRSTQRKAPRGVYDEAALTEDIIALARQYGRYGYRRVTALLRDARWHVNRKRVERIWRREGLKVPQKGATVATSSPMNHVPLSLLRDMTQAAMRGDA